MTRRASTGQAEFDFCVRRPPVVRDVRECYAGGAAEAIGRLEPGCEIFGFTKGQFSLSDIIVAVLDQTGPADVSVTCWSASDTHMRILRDWLEHKAIRSMRWVIDHSIRNAKPAYAVALVQMFGLDCIRVTSTHAKFVLLRNERWNIVIRSSMNLNRNPRFECFEISDSLVLAEYLDGVVGEIFERQEIGEILKRDWAPIGRTFRAMTEGEAVAEVEQAAEFCDDGFDLTADDVEVVFDE